MEDSRAAYRLNPDGLVDVFHEGSIMRAFMLFVQTARLVMKYKDSVFYRSAGLSDVKFIALMAFWHNPNGSLTLTEIANWTQTEPQNITALIGRMKKEGLVTAERNEKDRRFVNVTLANKGKRSTQSSDTGCTGDCEPGDVVNERG